MCCSHIGTDVDQVEKSSMVDIDHLMIDVDHWKIAVDHINKMKIDFKFDSPFILLLFSIQIGI